jgi:hypothetical protein
MILIQYKCTTCSNTSQERDGFFPFVVKNLKYENSGGKILGICGECYKHHNNEYTPGPPAEVKR